MSKPSDHVVFGNRLQRLDERGRRAIQYTWDNNGNLTNDGSKTYTYDQANRLTGVSATSLTWSATYNGDGARLRQVTNDVSCVGVY